MKEITKIEIKEKIKEFVNPDKFKLAEKEISKAIIDQEDIFRLQAITMFTKGHMIMDGNPGTAKTRNILTIGKIFGLNVTKVQLSGDMTPDQIMGYEMPIPKLTIGEMNLDEMKQRVKDLKDEFQNSVDEAKRFSTQTMMETIIRKGPLYGSELFLLDESNRGNDEVLNSLLSVMQEGDFRIGNDIFEMPPLFSVFATRNFIETRGTKNLAYAFLDRFIVSAITGYPSTNKAECEVIATPRNLKKIDIKPIYSPSDLIKLRILANDYNFLEKDNNITRYIARLIRATRPDKDNEILNNIQKDVGVKLRFGVSPRTSQLFAQAAAIYVYGILNENRIEIEHIQHLARPCLRHHLIFRNINEDEAMGYANEIIDGLIKQVPVI